MTATHVTRSTRNDNNSSHPPSRLTGKVQCIQTRQEGRVQGWPPAVPMANMHYHLLTVQPCCGRCCTSQVDAQRFTWAARKMANTRVEAMSHLSDTLLLFKRQADSCCFPAPNRHTHNTLARSVAASLRHATMASVHALDSTRQLCLPVRQPGLLQSCGMKHAAT